MYCPKCAAERWSDETSYCSSCGFRISEVAQIVEGFQEHVEVESVSPTTPALSPRMRGVKQSFYIFFFTFLLWVAVGLLQAFFRTDTRYVVIASLILIPAGFFRLFYALLFEVRELDSKAKDNLVTSKRKNESLPTSSFEPASDYFFHPSVERSPQTNELVGSTITDDSTRNLERREMP